MNSILSITSITGVTVISGSNFVTNQSVLNNGSAATGLFGSNGTSIGTAEGPSQTVRQSIIGLGSGNQFSRTITNVGNGFDEGQAIKGAGTGVDYGNIVSDRLHRQYIYRTLSAGPNTDIIITADGRYFSNADNAYVNPANSINLVARSGIAGSSETQNIEIFAFGGCVRGSGTTP
jgi:hypothetical protein